MTVLVITGGREHFPALAELEQLAAIIQDRGVTELRHGKARGTDTIAGGWVKARAICEVDPWPAHWDKFGKAAGAIRNRAMLDGGSSTPVHQQSLFGDRPENGKPPADLVVAFPGGRGTADCVKAARERGIEIVPINPVGEPRIWNRHHGPAPLPYIYVGRGSPLGNPYPVELQPGETRLQAAQRILGLYRRWLHAELGKSLEAREALADITADHNLVCSCWPGPCHAEVIVRAWRHRNRRE